MAVPCTETPGMNAPPGGLPPPQPARSSRAIKTNRLRTRDMTLPSEVLSPKTVTSFRSLYLNFLRRSVDDFLRMSVTIQNSFEISGYANGMQGAVVRLRFPNLDAIYRTRVAAGRHGSSGAPLTLEEYRHAPNPATRSFRAFNHLDHLASPWNVIWTGAVGLPASNALKRARKRLRSGV